MFIQYLPFLFLIVRNQNLPAYSVPTNMVSGRITISDPGPLTSNVHNYSTTFNETINNVEVSWGTISS